MNFTDILSTIDHGGVISAVGMIALGWFFRDQISKAKKDIFVWLTEHEKKDEEREDKAQERHEQHLGRFSEIKERLARLETRH